MNTIIAIDWARNWAVVSFTDIESVYTFSLGEVTTLSGAKSSCSSHIVQTVWCHDFSYEV